MAFVFRSRVLIKFQQCRKVSIFSTVRRNVAAFSTSQIQVKEDNEFEDKVALITGGASGIGFSIAKEFLKNGISAVSIVDIDEAKGNESCKELVEEFGEEKVLFVESDVGDSKQFDNAFKTTMRMYQTIDIVVNNAGIMNDTTWERQIKTNLCGNVIGTLLGMQYMSRTASGEGGIIINIGSIMSLLPSCGCPMHTMTQFGIVGFTKAVGALSHFERTGVKIMAICPGLTNTKLLTDAPLHTINENFSAEFTEETEGCQPQTPENVAKGLYSVMDEAKPGSVWVVENNGVPYPVDFPEIAHMKQKTAQ